MTVEDVNWAGIVTEQALLILTSQRRSLWRAHRRCPRRSKWRLPARRSWSWRCRWGIPRSCWSWYCWASLRSAVGREWVKTHRANRHTMTMAWSLCVNAHERRTHGTWSARDPLWSAAVRWPALAWARVLVVMPTRWHTRLGRLGVLTSWEGIDINDY